MKPKIMIIDDNEDVVRLVEVSLKDRYTFEKAYNGDEALDRLEIFQPDLIILDIMLPDMSGFELCSQIKSIDKFKNTPVIFLSGKTGSVARTTGYKLGAINYLEKPFEPMELRELVHAVIKGVHNNAGSEHINFSNIQLNLASQEVKINNEPIHFTASEFKILHYFIKNDQVILTREKILNHISPNNLTVNDRMIDTYISAIRKKIRESDVTIKSIYGEGYKIVSLK